MTVQADLLKILACPKCKSSLKLTDDKDGLSCAKCSVVYPIREDIPVMLVEEAVALEDWNNGVRETK
ncbi:Trm112 family protein [Halodesulfovibrio sp.]|uniref:Trm112 family protein n=1 Tax=Halodesulfovibrio sp. TaxID=1912772 RepID=UPI0025E5E66F|nr:Trm112 family protein [Halodesulfovibrio sp.]MCT4535696.1 Trm112 family protein [Halodesulfovibrio sp.]MCT4627083.1 Trm112 family protein [Halodesulfovibrio sp.]